MSAIAHNTNRLFLVLLISCFGIYSANAQTFTPCKATKHFDAGIFVMNKSNSPIKDALVILNNDTLCLNKATDDYALEKPLSKKFSIKVYHPLYEPLELDSLSPVERVYLIAKNERHKALLAFSYPLNTNLELLAIHFSNKNIKRFKDSLIQKLNEFNYSIANSYNDTFNLYNSKTEDWGCQLENLRRIIWIKKNDGTSFNPSDSAAIESLLHIKNVNLVTVVENNFSYWDTQTFQINFKKELSREEELAFRTKYGLLVPFDGFTKALWGMQYKGFILSLSKKWIQTIQLDPRVHSITPINMGFDVCG